MSSYELFFAKPTSSEDVVEVSNLLSIPEVLDTLLPGGWKLPYNNEPRLLQDDEKGNCRNFAEIAGGIMLRRGVPPRKMVLLESGSFDQGNPFNHFALLVGPDMRNKGLLYHHRGRELGHEILKLSNTQYILEKQDNQEDIGYVDLREYAERGTWDALDPDLYRFKFVHELYPPRK